MLCYTYINQHVDDNMHENIEEIIKSSMSVAEVLRKINMRVHVSKYKKFYQFVEDNNIDTSHFKKNGGKGGKGYSLDQILIEGSGYTNTHRLKTRLYKAGKLEPKCAECGLGEEWNGQPISLHLDHINGAHNDHRIENLRILCPNCHSQTDTYCGKNAAKPPRPKNKCKGCSEPIGDCSTHCMSCAGFLRSPTKIKWPEHEALVKMIEDSSYLAVGKKLNVSDNTVRKRIRNYEKRILVK